MSFDDHAEYANLLADAANRSLTRRALARKGWKLGLGLPAIAAALALRGSDVSAAHSAGCTEILVKDYDCAAGCQSKYNTCVADRGRTCKTDFDSCSSGCWYHPCSDSPGA